jgi:hypothetical protein
MHRTEILLGTCNRSTATPKGFVRAQGSAPVAAVLPAAARDLDPTDEEIMDDYMAAATAAADSSTATTRPASATER